VVELMLRREEGGYERGKGRGVKSKASYLKRSVKPAVGERKPKKEKKKACGRVCNTKRDGRKRCKEVDKQRIGTTPGSKKRERENGPFAGMERVRGVASVESVKKGDEGRRGGYNSATLALLGHDACVAGIGLPFLAISSSAVPLVPLAYRMSSTEPSIRRRSRWGGW